MADNGSTYSARHKSSELVIIEGSFATNAGSSPVAASNTGSGFSVARTGAGAYTITLAEKYLELVYAGAQVALATPLPYVVCIGATSVTGTATNTIALVVYDDTAVPAPKDIAAAAGNRIYFRLVLKNGSQTP